MIKHFLFILTFIIINHSFSQSPLFGIKESQYLKTKKINELIPLLIKGEDKVIRNAVKNSQAVIKYAYNNIYSIDIPKENLELFTKSLANIHIEIPIGRGFKMMDTALISNKVIQVHAGQTPLPQAYKGNGVIVGVLDSGIYFDHPDFKKADGSTRIRYIWDQNVTSGGSTIAPLPYNYGAEWSWIDIDNSSCNHIEPTSQYGHGTTVAGTASGNGSSGHFSGVAPESEIIAVAVDYYDNDFLTHLVDAVDYVFKKADALGKPCVVNISLGTYSGSHDGKDLAAQMIDALIEEREGRAVVASAGNGNDISSLSTSYVSAHLGYNVNTDTSFTWFKILPSEGKVYFDLWSDTANFKNVSFAFQNDNPLNFVEYGKTNFLSLANNFNVNLLNGVYHTEFVFNDDAQSFGKVEYYIEEVEGRYHLEFLISPDSLNHIWRFITTGNGTFDVWSGPYQGTSNMIKENLPPSFVVPDIVYYKTPDNRKSIVSSFQCSDKVITVGNFANKHHYYDVDSNYWTTGETPGEIANNSSEGPTRDNRLKPDISASGSNTFSTGNINFINAALASNRKKVSYDTLHQINGGTSISAPVVAGAVALYLQKRPTAKWFEIKEALIQTTRKDVFTGAVANNVYGNGKLDAFEFLKFDAVLGCTNNTSFNYNVNANIEDGSCIEVLFGCINENAFNFNSNANTDDGSCVEYIYGCMNSTAINYNEEANSDDGSCLFDVGINDFKRNTISFYPNPLIDQSILTINTKNNNVIIYNIYGKIVFQSKNKKSYIFKNKDFNKGVYFIMPVNTNQSIRPIKFVVQ